MAAAKQALAEEVTAVAGLEEQLRVLELSAGELIACEITACGLIACELIACELIACELIACELTACGLIACELTACGLTACELTACELIACELIACEALFRPRDGRACGMCCGICCGMCCGIRDMACCLWGGVGLRVSMCIGLTHRGTCRAGYAQEQHSTERERLAAEMAQAKKVIASGASALQESLIKEKRLLQQVGDTESANKRMEQELIALRSQLSDAMEGQEAAEGTWREAAAVRHRLACKYPP